MITHPLEPTELMAYLDGELSNKRAVAAAAHLDRCPECQSLAADLRGVSQSMLSWQVESTEMRMPHVVVPKAVRRPLWRRPWMYALASAAGLVVLVEFGRLPNRQVRMGSQAGRPARYALREFETPASLPMADLKAVPMIARTASLTVSTREFDRAHSGMDDLLKRHQGYLGNLDVSTPSGGARSLTAALRIPSANMDATVKDLKQLGRVETEQQSGEEVTEQYTDLEARLINARNTEQRLTDILRRRTGKLSDVLDVEKEISRVRGEIERMDGEKKALTKRIDFATINFTLSEVYQAKLDVSRDSTFGRIRNAAVDGWQSMLSSLIGIALLIASIAPTVLVWLAILFFPLRYAWRRWGKRPTSSSTSAPLS